MCWNHFLLLPLRIFFFFSSEKMELSLLLCLLRIHNRPSGILRTQFAYMHVREYGRRFIHLLALESLSFACTIAPSARVRVRDLFYRRNFQRNLMRVSLMFDACIILHFFFFFLNPVQEFEQLWGWYTKMIMDIWWCNCIRRMRVAD